MEQPQAQAEEPVDSGEAEAAEGEGEVLPGFDLGSLLCLFPGVIKAGGWGLFPFNLPLGG